MIQSKSKWIFSLCGVAVLSVALASVFNLVGNDGVRSPRPLVVVFLGPETFRSIEPNWFLQKATFLGAEVKFYSADIDGNADLGHGVSAVIVEKATARVAGIAKNNHLPVIAYGGVIPFSNIDLVIRHDDFLCGSLQAAQIVRFLGGKGDVILLVEDSDSPFISDYSEGVRSILKNYEEIHIFPYRCTRKESSCLSLGETVSEYEKVRGLLASDTSLLKQAGNGWLVKATRLLALGWIESEVEIPMLNFRAPQIVVVIRSLQALAEAAISASVLLSRGQEVTQRNGWSFNGIRDIPTILIPPRVAIGHNGVLNTAREGAL